MFKYIMAYENINSFKMKILSFLIIFFIVSSNIVSASKGGQSLLSGKEDLSPTNKKRKMANGGGYIKATIEGFDYNKKNKFSRTSGPRSETSKVIMVIPGDSTLHNIINEEIKSDKLSEMKIYYDQPITSLSELFYNKKDPNCKNIKTVDFSNFDSSQVTDTEHLFDGCTSLESVNFANFDGSKINTMAYMFQSCNNIKSIDLSWLTFEKLNSAGIVGMINNCNSLISLDLSKFNKQLELSEMLNGNSVQVNIRYIDLKSSVYLQSISNFIFGVTSKTGKTLYICTSKEKLILMAVMEIHVYLMESKLKDAVILIKKNVMRSII